MSDGQWIESATLDLWEGRHREQLNRIEELEAENHLLKTSGIVEVAVRNPSVMEYMQHWEGRAETAEAKLAQQDDLVQAAVLALMGYDAKGAGAKDAGEGFDLAISMALATIREGGK